MDYIVSAMMIAGLCVMVIPCALLLIAWSTTRRRVLASEDQRRRRLDLYMLCVWGGLCLVQLANILFHEQANGMYGLSSLTLMATAGNLFAFGVFAGRLLLRREIRLREQNA